MSDLLRRHLNHVRSHKGLPPLENLEPGLRLREDLELDSLDLAELTVRLEQDTGVDVFADGLVRTVEEVQRKLP